MKITTLVILLGTSLFANTHASTQWWSQKTSDGYYLVARSDNAAYSVLNNMNGFSPSSCGITKANACVSTLDEFNEGSNGLSDGSGVSCIQVDGGATNDPANPLPSLLECGRPILFTGSCDIPPNGYDIPLKLNTEASGYGGPAAQTGVGWAYVADNNFVNYNMSAFGTVGIDATTYHASPATTCKISEECGYVNGVMYVEDTTDPTKCTRYPGTCNYSVNCVRQADGSLKRKAGDLFDAGGQPVTVKFDTLLTDGQFECSCDSDKALGLDDPGLDDPNSEAFSPVTCNVAAAT